MNYLTTQLADIQFVTSFNFVWETGKPVTDTDRVAIIRRIILGEKLADIIKDMEAKH